MPQGLGASIALADLAGDPYALFARLRREEPVCRVPALGMWLVARRADVLTVLGDTANYVTDAPGSLIRSTFGSQMLSAEGEVQARFKSSFFPRFRPEAIGRTLQPQIETYCEELVDGFAGGGEAELRAGLAAPLALRTIAAALGIPEERHQSIGASYEQFALALANFDGDPAIRAHGIAAASALRPDLQAWLEASRLPGLTDEEMVSNAMIVLFGGIETTESAILNALWALLTHPSQLQAVREDPALVAGAIEESLRWEAAVQTCTRYTARAVTLAGAEIAGGSLVQCLVGSANRDEAHFAGADRFDILRANAGDHLTFGYGRHFCLGAALARLEVCIAIQTLLRRLPGLRMSEGATRPRGHEFRKPAWLRVRWG